MQNEKRQGENPLCGAVFDLIQETIYPEGHSYDHTVIGSKDDLNAAALEDEHNWFDTNYDTDTGTLVIAGT